MDFAIPVVIGAVLFGVTLQRTSGMGTGLALSPALTLAIGPVSGILLTNMTTVVSAAFLTVAVRADIDWRRYVRIASAAVAGSLPAALLVHSAGSGWLEVIIGTALLLSLAVTSLVPRLPVVPPVPAGVAAGVLGGFLNTSVGVAAAVLLAYAQVTRWEQKSFAATLQPIFLTMGLLSLLTKTLVGAAGDGAAAPPWYLIVAAIGSVPFGVLVGTRVAARVTAAAARRVAVVVVVLGATLTLVRGVANVVAG